MVMAMILSLPHKPISRPEYTHINNGGHPDMRRLRSRWDRMPSRVPSEPFCHSESPSCFEESLSVLTYRCVRLVRETSCRNVVTDADTAPSSSCLSSVKRRMDYSNPSPMRA